MAEVVHSRRADRNVDRSLLHPADPMIANRWLLPLMLLLSFGSGVAALIYEVVWFQLLELVIGSTAVSLGILLATFMGGMCLGSMILRHWRFYAIELGI